MNVVVRGPRSTKAKSESYAEKNEIRVRKKPEKRLLKMGDGNSLIGEANLTEQKSAKCKGVLEDYLESASVHGVQYFGKLEIKVGFFGKAVWACTMIAACVCASLMVMQFLRRYNQNPVNTYVATFHAPTYIVPFPAVTVCPSKQNLKETREKLLSRLRIPRNMTKEEAMVFLRHGYELSQPWVTERFEYLNQFRALLQANNMTLPEFLKFSRSCTDIFDVCWWNTKRVDCARIFRASYATRGVCCSFNYVLEDYVELEEHEEDPDVIYNDQYGPQSGLRVLFKKEIFEDDSSDGELSNLISLGPSILVLLHHSTEFPLGEYPVRVIQANREVQLSVKPSLYSRPAGLYHRNKQGHVGPLCLQNNENELEYFPKYRYLNCYANCVIQAAVRICGCVPYVFDPYIKHADPNSCGLDDLTCLEENEKALRITKDVYSENFTCSCTQPCENVLYDSTPVEFTLQEEKFKLTSFKNMTKGQAVLQVYLESQIFTVLQTLPVADEIYLLASIGGIFSLFLGCSFLSGVEIFYFVILLARVLWSHRPQKSAQKPPCNNYPKSKPFLY